MKGLLALLLFVWVTLVALFAPDVRAAHDRHVADYAQNSVVHLTIELEDGREGACTGFVIQPNIVMTAFHCVENATLTADGHKASVVAINPLYDLALLTTNTGDRPALVLRDSGLRRGEHLTAIGYAGGTVLAQMPGTVMLLRERVEPDLAPCIIASYLGIPGMSGGPVIDARGYLVSVVSRGITGISCGMSPELLHAFLYGAP
jgi:S1-C subfamily serine protease